MKNPSVDPDSVRDSVVIVRCRDLVLDASDRKEMHRSEMAFGNVFQKIHRIEWRLTGRDLLVEAKCRLRARTGEFAAEGVGANARAAVQAATEKVLRQKRRAKETAVTKRRTSPRRAKAD